MNINSKKLLCLVFSFSIESRAICADVESPFVRMATGEDEVCHVKKTFDDYDALNAAILEKDVDKVRAIIKKGANVNQVNSYGEAPLMIAMQQPRFYFGELFSIIKLLIAAGADVNKANEQGITPLLRAAYFKEAANVVKLLIDSGADVNQENIKDKRAYFKIGAGVIKEGDTPLITAAGNGAIENVRLLIDAGADINKVNKFRGSTPLTEAADPYRLIATASDCNKVMKLLIEKGADVNHADDLGFTALIKAVDNYNVDIIKLLIDHGASVNQQTKYGDATPLEVSIWGYSGNGPLRGYNRKVIKLLLLSGARVKNFDKKELNSPALLLKSDAQVIISLMEQGVPLLPVDTIIKMLTSTSPKRRESASQYLNTLKGILESENVNEKIRQNISSYLQAVKTTPPKQKKLSKDQRQRLLQLRRLEALAI